MAKKAGDLYVDIKGNTKPIQDDLTRLDQKVKNLGGGAYGGGASGLRNLNQQLFYIQQNAQVVINSFGQVFATANQWKQLGISAERSRMALTGLAGGAQEASRWIEAVNRGARGSLTEGEAAVNAYRLMRFGLADTAKEAQNFIDVVSKVAMINPQLGGTEEAINQIQLTLSNMSYMRLDQLGISAGTVRERVQELKDEIAGLSSEDAFRMAVMEQLGEQADMLGDEFVQLDDATQRLNARWRDFKEDAGLRVAEGFEAIAESVEGLIDSLETLGAKEFVIQLGLSIGQNLGLMDEEGREEIEVWRELFSNPQALLAFIDPKLFYASQNAQSVARGMFGYVGDTRDWIMGGGTQAPGLPPTPPLGIASSRYWWQPPGLGQGAYGRDKGPGFQTMSFDAMIRAGYSPEDIAGWERLLAGRTDIGIDYPWARIAGPENFRGMRAAGYTSPEVQAWQQQYAMSMANAYWGTDTVPPETLRRLQTQNAARDRFTGNRNFMQALIPTLFGGGGTLGMD